MASSESGGVPPGFRFHPTDEELLLYYLKKKISLDKFELEVIREIDLNKVEPWELQERCRIGSTPQNEWYFFSHKDRKYPTGSRTNRATSAGFWKATGRDKCIRTTYSKIGMRKTLVFYRGRAPHGHKTDWIMHEYRLQDSDDDPSAAANAAEDGWVVCRVFKKKCFFKVGGGGGGGGGGEGSAAAVVGSHMGAGAVGQMSSGFSGMHPNLMGHHYYHHHHNPNLYYSTYMQAAAAPPTGSYSHAAQLQDLLTNVHRPAAGGGYDFAVLPGDDVEGGGGMEAASAAGGGMHRHPSPNAWAALDGMDGRAAAAAAQQQQMSQMANQRGGEMDLWGYGK